MKEEWILLNKKADFNEICRKFNVSLPMAVLLVNRGYTQEEEIREFLYPDIKALHDYSLMKDVKKSAELIKKAIDNGENIRIVGDYDVDGVSATYLLFTAFEELGAFVTYRIPNRVTDGYGISTDIIKEAIADGIDMIVTCDNGIAAKSQIEFAKENKMTVIVTDHHDIPDELPPADCIVDPKQTDCDYPEKGICGAVVAAKLCEALYDIYGFGSFIEKHLDVMAVATVCDVMDLRGENRAIVKLGLEKINEKSNVGLTALAEECRLKDVRISAYNLGFVLGPCLNATGRLETADAGVELLRARSIGEARAIAKHLRDLNETRKNNTVTETEKAIEQIENSDLAQDSVLVVYLKTCHESIAGIIAGRLKEKFNRPAIVLTDSVADRSIVKGSGRSVEGYNMFEEIKACSKLLLKFGGHPMAAGLSLEKDLIQNFRKMINENCKEDLTDIPKKKLIDIRLSLSYSSCEFIEELKLLEPTGKGNAGPVFADRNVTVKRISWFGREAEFLKFELTDSTNVPVTAKMFNDTREFLEAFEKNFGERELDLAFQGKGSCKLHFTYSPIINKYNGERSVQIYLNGYMFPRASAV